MEQLLDLEGRRALVTGAGQNLGRGIALTLGRTGAEVLVNDLVEARAQDVVDEIEAAGGKGSVAMFDVTDWDSTMAGFAAVGQVDILVNNAGNAGAAGWTGTQALVDSTPADWAPWFAVNMYGVMHCVRAALPGMIAGNWGRIVTIISDAAAVGESNMAAYAAAKAGAAGFSRAVAREVGRYNITANNVAIGSMHRPSADTPEGRTAEEDQRHKEMFRHYIVRRAGEPEEVAGLIAYLVSPLGAWVSGQTYPVNGGYSIGL